MGRKEEIVLLLKSLLGKLDDSIDKAQYSDDEDKIIRSAEKCVEITKNLDNYLYELSKL